MGVLGAGVGAAAAGLSLSAARLRPIRLLLVLVKAPTRGESPLTTPGSRGGARAASWRLLAQGRSGVTNAWLPGWEGGSALRLWTWELGTPPIKSPAPALAPEAELELLPLWRLAEARERGCSLRAVRRALISAAPALRVALDNPLATGGVAAD